MGRIRFRQPDKISAGQRRGMSYRLLGVGSATMLAAALLSVLIAPAAARRPAPLARLAAPRPVARAWTHARPPLRAHRSTRRAPFLTWSTNKSLTPASIVNTYKVTTTADTTPASCPATASEPCTLRQAVDQANADGTLDKIQVPAATSPYLLETDQLVVTDAAGVVISGAGQAKTVVEADSASTSYPFRVLQITSVADGPAVQISNMTIEGGHSSTSTEDGNGGGIEVASGSLTMRNSTVTANTADNQGGGIYVAGQNSINQHSGTESQAYLKNVTISGNTAANGGGGVDVEGQAIMQGTVTGNTAGDTGGGGILLNDDGIFYPSLSASNLTVSANQTLGEGGGIANAGSLALTGGVLGASSNANGNSSQLPGGGLFNSQVATLDNVAVEHNRAQYGGGVENDDRVLMTGGSLSGNRAIDAGGLDNYQAQAVLNGVKVFRNQVADQAGGLGNVGNFGSLSVTGGSITSNTAPFNGGGIYSFQPTTVEGTTITGNTARKADGGGIYSQGSLTLKRVQLGTANRPNEAQLGGGLYTEDIGATVVRSTIEGNLARNAGQGLGGGIYDTAGASDELRQTTVAGNSSDEAGGGIVNDGATMSILTSTISGNQVVRGASQAFGGGIANASLSGSEGSPTGTLKMVNDTVTGNRAGGGKTEGFGGGIENNDLGASVTLTNVTVSRNRASTDGGGIASDGSAALRGTILAANTAAGAPANCDLLVRLQSNGYNLDNDGTCGLNGVGDQTGVNPKLGPLAHNGGPTETMALSAGSPAIDAVQFCPPPKTDQRGVKRQGPCDVGAYERVPDK